MNLPRARFVRFSMQTVFLLIMIVITMSFSAHAVAYLYTYTGLPFTEASGPDFPLPVSSYHITAQFIYDGNIVTDVDHSLPASFFMISDGFHTVSANDPSPATYLNIGAVDSAGLPTEWFLGITSPYAPTAFPVDSWWLTTQNRSWATTTDGSYVTLYTAPGIGDITGHATNFDMPGVWLRTEAAAPVPEPATLLLLSSGLLGFAGFRKAQKRKRTV